MEAILLFTVNCARCCAMAPFSSCSQALSHQVTTTLSLYCGAEVLFSLENCSRKDGTNSSSSKPGLTGTTSRDTLVQLVPKKSPPRRCSSCPVHIPTLKLSPTHKDLFTCLKSTLKKRKIKSCLPAMLQKQLLVHFLFLLVCQEKISFISTKSKNVDFFQVV